MSIADAIRVALKRAGSARTAHRVGAATEMAEIERLVREGHEAGIGKSELARLAEVSRQTINDILSNPLPQEDPQ